MSSRILSLLAASSLVLLVSAPLPGQGKGKGGGGGGGGGSGPAPIPASAELTYTEDWGKVYVVAQDGSGKTFIADGQASSWSPDGTRLAYVGRPGAGGVYVTDGITTQMIATASTPAGSGVDWSKVPAPDGHHRILFTDAYDVYSVRTDGSDRRQHTVGGGWSWPQWNYTADKFVAGGGANTQVFALDASLNVVASWNIVFALPAGGWYVSGRPSFANTQDTVIVSTDDGTSAHLCDLWLIPVMNPTAATQLTHGVPYGLNPAFSPDDSKIAFSGLTPGNQPWQQHWSIFTMDANGQNLVNVTNNTGWSVHRLPRWRP